MEQTIFEKMNGFHGGMSQVLELLENLQNTYPDYFKEVLSEEYHSITMPKVLAAVKKAEQATADGIDHLK